MTQQVDRQLVDAATDAYVEWREECTEVWGAYERWRHALKTDAAGAFAAYRAALDREESASHAYADLLGIAFGKRPLRNSFGRAVHAHVFADWCA